MRPSKVRWVRVGSIASQLEAYGPGTPDPSENLRVWPQAEAASNTHFTHGWFRSQAAITNAASQTARGLRGNSAWLSYGLRVVACPLITAAVGLFAGCQTYEPSPLDLVEHRGVVEARQFEFESLDAFVHRLRKSGAVVPGRFDLTDGISLAEGEVFALFYNPDLRLARVEAGIALANFENAGLWKDPEFGFDGAELISPDGAFEFGLSLNITVPVSGRLSIEKARAGAAYETELRRIVDAEWSTRLKIRSAWAAWTTAIEQARLQREFLEQLERITGITERLGAAGEISGVESRLFPIELAQRHATLIQAEFDSRKAKNVLLGLMGLAPSAQVELIPALVDSTLALGDDPLGELIASNTVLAVKRSAYQAAEETLRLEIRKQYPDLTIGSGYGSEDNDDRLLLGLSIPIPILDRNRAGIADAKTRREVARVDAETAFERLAVALEITIAAYEAAMAQRSLFESTIVPMVMEQAKEAERIAEIGAVDPLLLLTTTTLQYEAKSRLLKLRLTELGEALRVTELLGTIDEESPAPVQNEKKTSNSRATHEPGTEGGDR